MMKVPAKIIQICVILLGLALAITGFAQVDTRLVAELDSMVTVDQQMRTAYRNMVNQSADSLTKRQIKVATEAVDSLHFVRLVAMFEMHGFLDFDLVGTEGSYNFWMLVQHQDKHPEFQEAVLEKMELAAREQKASYSNYAHLLDRVRINTGRLQVFGTQMMLNADSTSYIPQPVEDPDKLDKRRKRVDLPPMNLYIRLMNERYAGNLRI